MPSYSYEIGSALDAMTNVETLCGVPPRGLAIEPFSVYRIAANGTEYGDGYPWTEWHFDVIEQDGLDALLAFLGSAQSASVYIRTRDAGGTYAYYAAVMHRPKRDEMEPRFLDRWANVRIKFTMLEVQS
jgi:hypothetical protein